MRLTKLAMLALAAGGLMTAHVPVAGATTYKVLYNFKGGSDGARPTGSLLNVNGVLYGATANGGGTGCGGLGCGTLFQITPGTGAEKVVYAFQGGSDGASPYGSLVNVNGTLYGVTTGGGTSSNGTVFQLNTATGAVSVVYSFKGGTDGASPSGGLIYTNSTLYGVTSAGGTYSANCFTHGCGTAFQVKPSTGAESVLYAFKGGSTDGFQPSGKLAIANGALFGTTSYGGGCSFYYPYGCGTVFKLVTATNKESVLYAFKGNVSDGYYPASGVIVSGGQLYGTTSNGGSSIDGGAIFKLSPTTGVETILHIFTNGADGTFVNNGLLAVNATLYGMTNSQGASSAGCGNGNNGCGTLFSLPTTGGTDTVLHDFTGGTDGASPDDGGSLIAVSTTLYGVTPGGGAGGCPGLRSEACGIVFSLSP